MSVIWNSGVSAAEGVCILKSMEIQSGHSELSVISQVSAVEGCPLHGVPLYRRIYVLVILCELSMT